MKMTDIVKYIDFKRLQLSDGIVRMDNSTLPKKYWMEISIRRTCGKTTSQMGRIKSGGTFRSS
jgi:hypothetical protein